MRVTVKCILLLHIVRTCQNSVYFGKSQIVRPRVVNGVDDVNKEYPYVVTLETINFDRLCTGTLIAKSWVLSAAHCIPGKVYRIRYGNMTVPYNATKSYSRVLKQIPHPGYIDDGTDILFNDIALFLIEPVLTKTYGRISTVDYKTLTGKEVRLAGYGLTYDFGVKNEHLYQIEDAKRSLQLGDGLIHENKENKFCQPSLLVAPKCKNIRHGASFGDSGGPLFYENRIVAVASGMIRDKRNDSPYPICTMYTPVSPYLNWIQKNIKDNITLE